MQALPSLFKVFAIAVFVFLFQLAFRLEISQHDAYSYMNMAKNFAGIQEWFLAVPRPPLLSFMLTPIALLRHLDITNETIFCLMHIVSVGISVGFIVVSYFLFKEVLRKEFAALAAILLIGQPGFLVYAFEMMADIPGAVISNTALLICLKYWNQNSRKFLIAVSTFSALAITAKYPLIVLPGAIWISSILNSLYLKRESYKNAFCNLFCLGFPILTLVLYLTFHFIFMSPHNGWTLQNLFSGIKPYFWHLGTTMGHGENPISFILYLESQMTEPVFYFMLFGLFVCSKSKNLKILIVWIWFTSFLVINIFVGKHFEFRYLFPILPACYFFFSYGFQEAYLFFEKRYGSMPQKILPIGVILILIIPTMVFGREIVSLQGNIYFRDFQSKVSKEVQEFSKQGGNTFWLGPVFAMYQPGKEIVENDPFYKVYHFHHNAISFYTDQMAYYLNYDTPYSFSLKVGDNSVFVINPDARFLYRPHLPEQPRDISPLMVGIASKRIFSLSKVKENHRVFKSAQSNDEIILIYEDGRLILGKNKINFLSNQFVLWAKILNSTGVSELPEKTIFYFDKDREKGNLINKKDFDSLREISLFNLKGRKYHFADSFVKK